MTTEQKQDALHETADRAAEHAFRALSNVARALADNTITPAELRQLKRILYKAGDCANDTAAPHSNE